MANDDPSKNEQSKDTQLKPCPHCGKKVKIVIAKEEDGFKFFNIYCKENLECDFRMSDFYDKDYMIQVWNTRTIEDNHLKHIANLESFISQTMKERKNTDGEIAEQLQVLADI